MYCKVCSDPTVNNGQDEHLHNPVNQLSDEVFLSIFQRLSRQDVAACSQVSHGWRKLSEDHTLWAGLEGLLGITAPLELGENCRLRVSQRVAELQKCVLEADPLLSKAVKTEQEFRQARWVIFNQCYTLPTDEVKRQQDELASEEAEQRVSYGKLKEGLAAHVLLRKAGLSSFANLEKYAVCLHEKYDSGDGWLVIVKERVEAGEIDKAEIICNANMDSVYRGRSLGLIISKLCADESFDEAFACLTRNHRAGDRTEGNWKKNAISIIFSDATGTHRYDIIERVINEIELDAFPELMSRIYSFINLLQKNDLSDGAKVLRKFKQDLHVLLALAKENSFLFEIPVAISILVKFEDIKGAWDVALSNMDANRSVLHELRNAFEKHKLFDEAQKVTDMIGGP
ncbi:MAG: hypothetical protein KR126chlam2_00527 [Chlamydiae bacterium]|nr:hypothetical protein [Chlamydiota bacterium]